MATNEDQFCVCMADKPSPHERELLTRPRAALLRGAAWQPGTTIAIRFLEGGLALHNRVMKIAMAWLQHANLKFQFVQEEPSDIRIAFRPGRASWSYLGTVCRRIAPELPTMNFGWAADECRESVLRRVVLHEFGHALGLTHEHASPRGGIEWNRAALNADLSSPPNDWYEPTIDYNLFLFYAPAVTNAVDADPLSIMRYPIPRCWTLRGFSVGFNDELSDGDKQLIRAAYPQ